MPSLNTARQNGVILVILLFGQLLLLSGSVRHADGSTRLEGLWMRVTSPVIGVAEGTAGAIRGAYAGTRDLFTAHGRNQALRADLRELRAELDRHREAVEENQRLRRLLTMRDYGTPAAIGASVVQAVYTDDVRMIAIDRGRRDGVVPDLPVITWGGAVGRVVTAGETHAKVRLLVDPSSGVGALVQRSRTRGLVLGAPESDGGLRLRYVPRFADVEIGDRVVTSGADGVFPKGFGIGTVVSVVELADGTQTIQLLPEIDFRTLDEVLVLTDTAAVDLGLDDESAEDAS